MGDTYHEVRNFLNREAELLDDHERREWLDEMLTEDITYRAPVRIDQDMEFTSSDEAYLFHEDRENMEGRVSRFETEYAWSEKPPTRTRRIVSNIRIEETDGDEISVKNYIQIFKWSGEETMPQIITGERHDVLRRVDGELKLADREILIDQNRIDLNPLSVFF